MTELLQAIYEYARQTQCLSSLEEEKLYQESREVCQRNYQTLCTTLPEKAFCCLQNYTGEMAFIHSLELEAMYRAGLSIGLELSRL